MRLSAMVPLAVLAVPSAALAQSQGFTNPALPPLPAPPPAAPPVASPPSTGNVKPAPPSEVWVHLDAPVGTLLLQQTTDYADWTTACSAPCDKLLPTSFRYRVGGGGVTLSADFLLSAPPGTHETLAVDGSRKTAFIVGVTGAVVGPIVNFVGFIFVLSLLGGDGPNPPILYSGLAMMGIGTLSFIVGIALAVSNAGSETQVTQRLDATQAGILLPGSWTKTPTWSAATEQRNLPPAVGIPIFRGRF